MTDTPNPFDAADRPFLVLVNDLGQHSLWPAAIDVPAGWDTAHGPQDRAECLRYVDRHWTDLRPATSPRGGRT
jgi:MbtH protein